MQTNRRINMYIDRMKTNNTALPKTAPVATDIIPYFA